jgi:DGQHR domain-containing protein
MGDRTSGMNSKPKQAISVIVPKSPFVPVALRDAVHCLAALDVADLMRWWPGQPHDPHRNANKVRAIQRSLDWKRVGQIAAYLLQREIVEARDRLTKYFEPIYEPKALEPGREWPPRVPRVIGYERSEYPIFSNVLIHLNGANVVADASGKTGKLTFDEDSAQLNFSVIDGQHRINGAYFALCLMREDGKDVQWEIPAEIFLDLDKPGAAPRHQAQIFIDVNFNQKKVDRSLVADLFPTARGRRAPLDQKERAQDLGRRLMLEIGPLVGMIQIPGIKYGVKDVVTLATLNSAIEDILDDLDDADITSLDEQAEFLAQCLEAWFIASGRKEIVEASESLDPENVAYQGRVVVSFLTLIPACIWKLKITRKPLASKASKGVLAEWLKGVLDRAGLLQNGKFLPRTKFRQEGYLGSGGLARFRDQLWAAALSAGKITRYSESSIAALAQDSRLRVKTVLTSK